MNHVLANAGPLWLLLESVLESLPVRPEWILLGLVIAALVTLLVATLRRRK